MPVVMAPGGCLRTHQTGSDLFLRCRFTQIHQRLTPVAPRPGCVAAPTPRPCRSCFPSSVFVRLWSVRLVDLPHVEVCLFVCLSIGGGHPGGLFARRSIEWADRGRVPGEAMGRGHLSPAFLLLLLLRAFSLDAQITSGFHRPAFATAVATLTQNNPQGKLRQA